MNEKFRVLMPILLVIMVAISVLVLQINSPENINIRILFIFSSLVISFSLFILYYYVYNGLSNLDDIWNTLYLLAMIITVLAALISIITTANIKFNLTPTLFAGDVAVTVMRNDNQIVQRIISTEEIKVNNCGGSAAVIHQLSRTGTVANTVEIDQSYLNNQGEFYIEGLGAVPIGQEIASEYGLTYGQVEQRERSIVLETEEQTNVAHTIQNIESWQSGEIVVLWKDQEVGRYPYLFRTDFDLNYVGATNLACSE